jgi:hypothetical protein
MITIILDRVYEPTRGVSLFHIKLVYDTLKSPDLDGVVFTHWGSLFQGPSHTKWKSNWSQSHREYPTGWGPVKLCLLVNRKPHLNRVIRVVSIYKYL